MAEGEAAPDTTEQDLLHYGIAAAIAAGHDPRDVREWAVPDVMRFAVYDRARGSSRR